MYFVYKGLCLIRAGIVRGHLHLESFVFFMGFFESEGLEIDRHCRAVEGNIAEFCCVLCQVSLLAISVA